MYNLFSFNSSLIGYFSIIKKEVKEYINSLNETEILNQNESDIISSIFNKYKVNRLVLYLKDISYIQEVKQIPVEYLNKVYLNPNELIDVPNFVFQIPFEGDKNLLKYRPSSFQIAPSEYYTKGKFICFELIKYNDNFEHFEKEINRNKDYLKFMVNNINKDTSDFNVKLRKYVENEYFHRKKELIKNNEFLCKLGIPKVSLGSKEQNKKINYEPVVVKEKVILNSINSSKLSPSLSEEDYEKILESIYNYASSFEDNPSICKNKNEEGIRDLILAHLSSVLSEESVTAESKNNKGKTDILIKHKNNVIFVAECKIWNGPKNYGSAINQLLNYLTWKNQKAALLIFVKKNKMSTVLDRIRHHTPEHECFVKEEEGNANNWFNYTFNLKSDVIKLSLAILVFKVS